MFVFSYNLGVRDMNREALPLILAILVPIVLVSLVLLYVYGYEYLSDIIVLLRKIDLIYYIIVLPVALGLLVALLKWKRT